MASSSPCVTLVDPVPDLVFGTGIKTDKESLAKDGVEVTGVAADSVSRLVIRVRARFQGDRVRLTLWPDGEKTLNGLSSPSGELQTLLPADGSASGPYVVVTATNTNKGPMAFALYVPPADFSRGGEDDIRREREVSLIASFAPDGDPGVSDITIKRPPVVLVHGQWGAPEDWYYFRTRLNEHHSTFWPRTADYNVKPNGSVSASEPVFSQSILNKVKAHSLGLDYNAPMVLRFIRDTIADFHKAEDCAISQADVVAHSMGGVITRTLMNLPDYLDVRSFQRGSVHKLITIGSPHLGSPLAARFLSLENTCIRDFLAKFGKASIATAVVAGKPTTGSTGDLRGDANGTNLSEALSKLKNANGHEVPTALIAATTLPANTLSLDTPCQLCVLGWIRDKCSANPLVASLTSSGWNAIFGQPNDGMVSLSSQTNGGMGAANIGGVVHSSGLVGALGLGFTGPEELDPDSSASKPVFDRVKQLLNTPIEEEAFHRLP